MNRVNKILVTAVTAAVVIAVILAIGFFVNMNLSSEDDGETPLSASPPAVERIKASIDSLRLFPVDVFCSDTYVTIKSYIDDDYEQRALGKDGSENEQIKNSLTLLLNEVYISKFCEQAYDVFGKNEWKQDDLSFISSEMKKLKPLLEEKGDAEKEFEKISSILVRYNTINDFIVSCQTFPANVKYELDERVPLDSVKTLIQMSNDFLKNDLVDYLKNCTRLSNQLKQAPNVLFNNHVKYINTKLDKNRDGYRKFTSQREFFEKVQQKLRNEITAFESEAEAAYGVSQSVLSGNIDKLREKEKEIGNNAFNHEYN